MKKGMAVDANVLIFARISEELKNNIDPQSAIKNGFKAFKHYYGCKYYNTFSGTYSLCYRYWSYKGLRLHLA